MDNLYPPDQTGPHATVAGATAGATPPQARVSLMQWLERKSQPYIVLGMATVAVIRGFYLFTDKLINLSRYAGLNHFLSLVTGIMLSLASELTITIGGRRHKLYKQQLFNARLEQAKATTRTRPIWDVQVERYKEQVRANRNAMYVSMGMSLIAAASYLIDSTGAAGFLAFAVASALAGYVLYLMYYHGVQTDEIREDRAEQTAQQIATQLDEIRLQAVRQLADDLHQGALPPAARLAFIATGLRITDQRQYGPALRMLIAPPMLPDEEDEDQATVDWLSARELALRLKGPQLADDAKRLDYAMRPIRDRLARNFQRYKDRIRLDDVRGWIIEPNLAADFFKVPASGPVAGAIVEADEAPRQAHA